VDIWSISSSVQRMCNKLCISWSVNSHIVYSFKMYYILFSCWVVFLLPFKILYVSISHSLFGIESHISIVSILPAMRLHQEHLLTLVVPVVLQLLHILLGIAVTAYAAAT
jgi:uncharacterized paraquat-inducible protein A